MSNFYARSLKMDIIERGCADLDIKDVKPIEPQDSPPVSPTYSWEAYCEGKPGLIVLPGAWAVGDGLILEAHDYGWIPEGQRSVGARESVESLGARVLRFAGSLSSSVNEYFTEFTSGWSNSVTNSDDGWDSADEADTAYVSGEIVWIPSAGSCTARASSMDLPLARSRTAPSKKHD